MGLGRSPYWQFRWSGGNARAPEAEKINTYLRLQITNIGSKLH